MDLNKLHITEADYNFFQKLTDREKVEYFWECQFTDDDMSLIPDNIEPMEHDHDIVNDDIMIHQEIIIGPDRMTVVAVNGFYYLNATRLTMIRSYIRDLTFNKGIILLRVYNARKTKYDPYRYFLCYECIGQSNPISPN